MSDPIFQFDLGDEVRDRITGLKGIILSRTQWYNKCIRYCIQPKGVKDGKIPDGINMDEESLEMVKAQAIPSTKRNQTGGPQRGETKSWRP